MKRSWPKFPYKNGTWTYREFSLAEDLATVLGIEPRTWIQEVNFSRYWILTMFH